jgi:hypothetical protein
MSTFYEGMSVGVALLAFGSFGFCTARLGRSVPAKIAPLVTFRLKASFCIYLVHIFFLKAFASLGFTVRIRPASFRYPCWSRRTSRAAFACICFYPESRRSKVADIARGRAALSASGCAAGLIASSGYDVCPVPLENSLCGL